MGNRTFGLIAAPWTIWVADMVRVADTGDLVIGPKADCFRWPRL